MLSAKLSRIRTLRKNDTVSKTRQEDAEERSRTSPWPELRRCEKALEDTILRAPFDGLIVKRRIEEHEHVEARQTILLLRNVAHVEVEIHVPERLFDINFHTYPNGGVWYFDPSAWQVLFVIGSLFALRPDIPA